MSAYLTDFWSFIGSLQTPQMTLIAALLAAVISITTIKKTRSTAREKNALDFEMNCQNNEKFQQSWIFIQRNIISPMFIDNELDKSRQNEILKPLIDLPNKLNQERKQNRELKKSGTPSSKTEMVKYEKKEDLIDINSNILNVLNVWERCANAIRHGIYDEQFIYSSQSSTLIRTYKSLKPYIDGRRKLNKNSRIYVNVEWLATKWELTHTMNGDATKRALRTVEVINVARKRMKEHTSLRRCYLKLKVSLFLLKWYKKP